MSGVVLNICQENLLYKIINNKFKNKTISRKKGNKENEKWLKKENIFLLNQEEIIYFWYVDQLNII